MATFLGIQSSSRLEKIKSELVLVFDSVLSKIDTDLFIDYWRKWRIPIFTGCGALVCTYFMIKTCRAMNYRLKHRRFQFIIDEKRKHRSNSIHRLHKRLEMSASPNVLSKRREIVLLNFDELQKRLQLGNLTAIEVLEAYQWRALEAHSQTNCICHFLPEATAWAASLDTKYSQNSNSHKKPPLFGIPISLCESYQVNGHDCTLGILSNFDQSYKEDAVLIKTIRQLGAVPFVITNVSQGLLSVGCSNPIYGATTNPNDPVRSPGGSCGGEAALIAMLGSPVGFTVDDPGGGSRIPAHWCGVCSLKPTSTRLSNIGTKGITTTRKRELGAVGLMGPTVASMVGVLRAVCSSSSLMYHVDPFTVPLAFNDDLYTDNRPLTIGYFHNDGLFSPVQACSRAVDVAKRILENKGHILVQIPWPFSHEEFQQMLMAYTNIFTPDGGKSILSLFESSNPPDTSYEYFLNYSSLLPSQKRRISKRVQSRRLASIFNVSPASMIDYELILSKIDNFKCKFIRFWTERKLDCIICPASISTPLPLGLPEKMFFLLWWNSAIWNILDFPCGIVRCTTVTIGDERAATMGNDEIENDWISIEIRKYAEGTVGLPVGVQCVALPFREEMCLRMMKDIESGARN